jgi:uncharacterized protein DUF6817
MMRDREEPLVEVLRSWGAAARLHSLTSLLDHLLGTRELLRVWGADPDLANAGLFHSVYGTESFADAIKSLKEREAVRRVLGARSEQLVYIFSVMTRDSFDAALINGPPRRARDRTSDRWIDLDEQQFVDLCNLSAANWLDQRPRLPEAYRTFGRERYKRMLSVVLPAAAVAICEAFDVLAEPC